ncbi:P-loop containing nucleoside triphosphate hydrolase protein [Tilletiopsis washingtonensis]|uniref:RNA helicase n=1 Tax=Tilletiopsis washingtonensis TaxID=58919 RepID=A0A316Z710_9BASI|nr:P-loop containing nucleoside triphosphate hydrolase protein [Tilletiopsis washingtonensis]PWN96748.1 P-loop containing nucleoside triphosphate hydrolase protein [Tilletiopsis washingtonensis]
MPHFWKPGTARPGSSLDRASEAESSFDAGPSAARSDAGGIAGQRARLPIAKQRQALLYLVEQHPVVVVVGQTGSGKTTQLPQYLLEAGWAAGGRQIAVTQPRRLSAVSVAARVAAEVGCPLGDEVGYTIRFEDLSHSTRTRIRYCTDGMLFRECMRDPLLSRYSVIMVDEAHERGAYTDMLLGLLKKIRKKRPSLRIIISSATIDAQAFADFFNEDLAQPTKALADAAGAPPQKEAAIISLEGRAFPVQIAYAEKPVDDYLVAAIDAAWKVHLNEPQGDILVFLTGRDEIDACMQALADRQVDLPSGSLPLALLPLHAGLSSEEQAAIFEPAPRGTRKCLVATNIAEASVTIDGVKYVIDSGFVKLRIFNPRTGMDALSVLPESQASANQRAGRAGRTAPGKCLRLFPEAAFDALPLTTPPELARSDISTQVLQLKALGIDNLARFAYLPPAPPSEMLVRALEFLASLGALDDWGRLTKPLGERMAELPVDPMLAKVLLESLHFRCSDEILSIAAMTSVSTPFIIPDEGRSRAGAEGELERRKFTAEEGDHLTLLNVYAAFVNSRHGKQSAKWCGQHRLNFKALSRAVNIRAQLLKYLQRFGIDVVSCEGDGARLRKCIAAGFFKNAARVQPDGSYRSVRENAVLHVHPSSVLFSRVPPTKYVVFHEVVETSKRFMRDLTVVEEDWLTELAPHFYVRANR